MSYAIKKDGTGWRSIGAPGEIADDEVYSVDMPDAPVDLANAARVDREPLLRAADLAINKAEDVGQDSTPWRKYRQALRDITKQKTFPKSITWPELPQ